MNRRGFTFVEIITAIAAASGVFIAILFFMTHSTSQLTTGQSNLNNLYETGRILTMLRADLEKALSISLPEPDSPPEILSFSAMNDSPEKAPLEITWSFEREKKAVKRVSDGKEVLFGTGLVKHFETKVLLQPAVSSLKNASKVSVAVEIKLAGTGKPEQGREITISHIITPNSLNLFLQSKSSFN